ncbi:MAG: glycosyltransferase family 2 protein [Nitrososphaerota archaeon]|jgi:hyaluronan synthase|nr:glycosyltransferase family 2 protein [Nitrososphaerota archaeon]
MVYGLVVTPLVLFSYIVAFLYKPVPDRGYRPIVSVIVPVYNEGDAIGNTIDSILSSDYPSDKLELVVVDDKSKDNSLEVINKKHSEHDFNFKVISLDKNRGKRYAMAEGFKQCTGEIFVFVDSDTIVKPSTIRMLVQPFTDEKVYAIAGNGIVVNESEKNVNSLLVRFQKLWYAESFRIRKGAESVFDMVTCCSGVLAAYRKDKVELIVDEWVNDRFFGCSFESSDDRQITNLMLRLGGKSVFQSTALAYTIAPQNLKKFLTQQVRWGRGYFRGEIFAAKFFYKRSTLQKSIFYANTFVTFVAPFSIMLCVAGLILMGNFPALLIYLADLTLVTVFIALATKLLVPYYTFKDVIYRIFFFFMPPFISFAYLYGWFTLWKGGTWGTR